MKRAITIKNIQAGFRCTGIYPCNRDIDIPSKPSDSSSLAEHTGVKFIPLYSPVKPRIRTCYTKEEEVKFQRRLEEGYDLEGDMRYNLWKDMHLQEPERVTSGACTDNTCILLSSPTSRVRLFFWSLYQ